MKQRILILFFLVVHLNVIAQGRLSIVSWNLKDMGKSKSDAAIGMIANMLFDYDIVAIQEVVAGPGGAQAIARLADELNRKGTKWEYEVSGVTSGDSRYKAERYAFLWKSARVSRVGKGWLESQYGAEIEREPFYGRFRLGNETLTLVNYHAVPKSQQPEREVKYFQFLPALYPDDRLIFCGDFNLSQFHSVFGPLRSMGYFPVFIGQKTTLRQRCLNGDCLASEFDNIYYRPAKISLKAAGIVHFYRLLPDIVQSRRISDHIPIFAVYEL